MRITHICFFIFTCLILSRNGYTKSNVGESNLISDDLKEPYFRCSLFYDSSLTLHFNQVADQNFFPKLQSDVKINIPYTIKDKSIKGIWIYSEWKNNSAHKTTRYFYIGAFPSSSIYLFNESLGDLEYYYLKNVVTKSNSFIFPLTFMPNSSYKLWINISGHYKPFNKLLLFINTESSSKTEDVLFKLMQGDKLTYKYYHLPLNVLLGVLICMMLFSIVYFTLNHKKVFIYYFLYLLFTFLYFFIRHHDNSVTSYYSFQLEPFRDITWQTLSYLFYFFFAISFVDYKNISPILYKTIQVIIYLIITYLIFDIFLYQNHFFEIRNKAYNIFRITLAPIAIIIILSAFLIKSPLSKILATGSLLMVSGATVTMILSLFYYPSANPFINYHMLYMQLGIILEVICFTLGLSYMSKIQFKEKIIIESQLNKIKENYEIDRLQTIINTQDNERKRVASELHDDLGAGLSTIRLLSELALQKTEGKTEIKRISELSNELVDSMRQIIWSMNPESSSLSDFIHYLKRYTMEIIELNGKIFNFKLNQEISDYTLSPEQKRNLFLIIKETLHNSIKHSKSNEIILIYDYIEKRHHLTIKDNGIGFSPDDINYKNGNGLINIQKRAMQIGCSVFVTSEITKGTITRIEFS